MSKILTIDDMLEAMSGADVPVELQAHFTRAAEVLADDMAALLAMKLHVRKNKAAWLGKEFGGLCVSFYPVEHGQPCPAPIDEADPDGDWL